MAKWGDLADWRGPTVNQGGKMTEQRGVVLHIAEGSYEGTISWQKNPDAEVSSHFIAAKDGRAAQMVDTGTTAWTQKAGNGKWLSIENEGSVPDKLTDHQMEFAAQILARAHKEYGVPLQIATSPSGRGLGHHSMGSHPGYADDWGHSECPGSNIIKQKDAIVARAKEIVEGNDVGQVEGFTKEGFKDMMKTDDAIPNLPWRSDYVKFDAPEGATGPNGGTNRFIMWETWFDGVGQYLFEQAKLADQRDAAIQAQIAELKAMITGGVEVSPIVKVAPESVAAIADATADEIRSDPERDGA